MTANLIHVPDETVGAQVKRRRTALHMSLRQLAEEANVDRARITALENGAENVREITTSRILATLSRLEKRYGVDDPDEVVNVLEVELADGRKVRATFTGPVPEGMHETVARLVRELEGKG